MISEFSFNSNIKDNSRLFSEFDYIDNIPFFQKVSKISFSPGINVLIGPNGCGKSTVLKLLASSLAAEQGGRSTVTHSWLSSIRGMSERYSVVHDGQPILACDTNNDVGLIGGMAGFDDDFMAQGIAATQRRMSSGWTRMDRMAPILKAVLFNAEFPDKIALGNGLRDKDIPDFLKGTIPLGPRTVLVDEPESALTFSAQKNIIDKLIDGARKHGYQLIFATHSPFILPYLEDDDICYHNMSERATFKLEAQLAIIDLGDALLKKVQQRLKKKKEESKNDQA